MALNNLKITVVNGGNANEKWASDKPLEKSQKKEHSKMYGLFHLNDTLKGKVKQALSPTTFFAMQQGIGLATQTAKQFINYYVSDIGRANGDSNYQAIVNRRIEQVTDGLSIAQGALSGAAAGSVVPGIGWIVGAAVGAASSGVNLGFKYAERGRAYAHEMFQQSNSQAYNLARANYSALTGRVR